MRIDEDITINDSESRMYLLDNMSASIRVPVLGRVAAGIPNDAIEEILGYVDIPEELAENGEFFGLRIKGDSMEPRFFDGDTVIVLKTNIAESGDVVIASVNEDDAVCKKYVKHSNVSLLKSFNSAYEDIDVTNDSEFRIIGVVTELRRTIKEF